MSKTVQLSWKGQVLAQLLPLRGKALSWQDANSVQMTFGVCVRACVWVSFPQIPEYAKILQVYPSPVNLVTSPIHMYSHSPSSWFVIEQCHICSSVNMLSGPHQIPAYKMKKAGKWSRQVTTPLFTTKSLPFRSKGTLGMTVGCGKKQECSEWHKMNTSLFHVKKITPVFCLFKLVYLRCKETEKVLMAAIIISYFLNQTDS